MWVHNLNPEIFSLGPISVRWYGLVYVVGFLLAYWLLVRAARAGKVKNLDEKGVDTFLFWFIILTIVGARLVYVFVYNPAYFLATPWKVIATWEGGLSFHGGLVGAVVAGVWFCKKYSVRFYQLADILVVPLAIMLVFGRLANFINGELAGIATTPEQTPWCIVFPAYGDSCRHPSQLYEALKNLIVFLALLPLSTVESIGKKLKEGTIFWAFVFLYGLGRFITDFWRTPDPTDPVIVFMIGQWFSLAMVVLAIVFLVRMYWPRT